jgi:hypothetical protein
MGAEWAIAALPVADFSASSNVKCRAREAEGTNDMNDIDGQTDRSK